MSNSENRMVSTWRSADEAHRAERAAFAAWDRDPENAEAWQAWHDAEGRWCAFRDMSDAEMNAHVGRK